MITARLDVTPVCSRPAYDLRPGSARSGADRLRLPGSVPGLRAEGGVEVVPEVVGVLQADREAQQPVADAVGVAVVGVDHAVTDGGGVLDEGVDAAEADGRGDQPDAA